MSAKYCIHTRCSGMKEGKPCAVADDCPMFKWDIERQKGEKKETGAKTNDNLGEKYLVKTDKKIPQKSNLE